MRKNCTDAIPPSFAIPLQPCPVRDSARPSSANTGLFSLYQEAVAWTVRLGDAQIAREAANSPNCRELWRLLFQVVRTCTADFITQDGIRFVLSGFILLVPASQRGKFPAELQLRLLGPDSEVPIATWTSKPRFEKDGHRSGAVSIRFGAPHSKRGYL